MRELKLPTVAEAEAEQRMHEWVLAAGVESLEADWVAIQFDIKRLRKVVDAARFDSQVAEIEMLRAALREYSRELNPSGVASVTTMYADSVLTPNDKAKGPGGSLPGPA